jgi:two-component system sensor histidine kinase KdpD
MQKPPVKRALRCVVSAGLSILLIIGATRVPHVNDTTVALALVLLILGIAMRWGWAEALVTSLAGGIGFDYYFLPPAGLKLEAPEDWVALGAFMLTAITTGHLSARATRDRAEAERRRDEMAKLDRLGTALLATENIQDVDERLTAQVTEIFSARGAAFLDRQHDVLFRSGPIESSISREKLQEVALTGNPLINSPERCIVPIRRGGELVGSLGLTGVSLSAAMAGAIAERVGVALARAYTAQASMAAELARKAENLKSAVLDALAHEIKSPLATIKVSVTTLLSQQSGDAAQQHELLTIIDEESDRIEGWIDDAIHVSRSDAARLRLKKQSNSMKQVAERALEGLGPLAGSRSIEVRIPESLPMAEFDAEMIEKVIRLVLDNALKYSPPGSPIVVSAEFTGAEIVLNVEDHGPGVPDSEKERIFESYYRGSSGRQSTTGAGLGLASAKFIMQAHGGEIWVTSAPGSGSAFHISLPATRDVPDEQPQSAERG